MPSSPRYRSLVDPFWKLNSLLMMMFFASMMFIYCFIGATIQGVSLFTDCNTNIEANIQDIKRIDYTYCNFTIDYDINNKTYTNNILSPCSLCIGENCDKFTICHQYFDPNHIDTFDPKRETYQDALSQMMAYISLMILTLIMTSIVSRFIRKEIINLTYPEIHEP
jgi:hypothetical protein